MELISIIVPVYNVKNYLRMCVDSIVNQTYENLEILLLDDGSTDGSAELCDELAETDARIKVYHQKNSGISATRNVGISMAAGEYIGFVDSDDYVDSTMYEKMITKIKEENGDLVICGYQKVDENNDYIENDSPIRNEVLNSHEAVKRMYEKRGWYYVTLWNRLYRRELFQNLKFWVGKKHEDLFLAQKILLASNKIVTISERLYFYRATANSIMTAKADIGRLDGVEAAYLNYRELEAMGLTDLLPGAFQMGRDHLEIMGRIQVSSKEERKRRKEIIQMYRYMFRRTKGNKKLKNCIISAFPNIYFMIKYWIKRY